MSFVLKRALLALVFSLFATPAFAQAELQPRVAGWQLP